MYHIRQSNGVQSKIELDFEEFESALITAYDWAKNKDVPVEVAFTVGKSPKMFDAVFRRSTPYSAEDIRGLFACWTSLGELPEEEHAN